ncbi:DUF2206 domain-containing protein [Halorussus caseinilyticus]|uniref:DUF2206 domain-containing protein n=1 Tax=Halorussus caseinilyticus TaxID=3034025 RepID=A0ABD5WQD5_9EURY
MALLYHNSLFGSSIGGPSGAAQTLETGVWSASEESVLPNGVLFPAYTILTGLRLGITSSTVNPLLVSFLPVILFEGYREQVGDRAAFSSACLFMFSFPFYVLYPSAGRVATPVFFLALEGLVLSDSHIDLLRKRILGVLFGMGLAVSHYGTAYVAMVAFGTAFVTYLLLGVIDKARIPLSRGTALKRLRSVNVRATVRELTPRLLSPWFVTFYVAFVVEWYFYTSGGDKFAILPRKVLSVVNRFFEASASGTAGSAVSKEYGSTSVAISRQFYILIGALMGIGLAATMVARVFRKDTVDVDDEFLALAVGFMSMLGASFFVVGFNVARIMMIVFTFTAVFVVYGLGSIVEAVLTTRRVLRRVVARDGRGAIGDLLGVDFERAFGGLRTELTAVSVVLCVFLLLNAGFVTVFFTHDYAPSNIVTQDTLEKSEQVQVQLKARGCVNCDIESHVWLFSHRNRSSHAYGDFMAWAQVDFYRGSIAGRLSYYPKKVTYRSMWAATNGTDTKSLLLVLDHNTDTGVMLIESKYYWKDMAYIEPVTNRSHRVYTTGETAIYRSTGRATKRAFDFERPVPTNVTNVTEYKRLAAGSEFDGDDGPFDDIGEASERIRDPGLGGPASDEIGGDGPAGGPGGYGAAGSDNRTDGNRTGEVGAGNATDGPGAGNATGVTAGDANGSGTDGNVSTAINSTETTTATADATTSADSDRRLPREDSDRRLPREDSATDFAEAFVASPTRRTPRADHPAPSLGRVSIS